MTWIQNGACRHWQALLSSTSRLSPWCNIRQVGRLLNFKLLLSVAADTLALLLTDALVFLQEKDQRFVFAAVVSLQPISTSFLLTARPPTHLSSAFSPPGPEASRDSAAEAHRPGGRQRGERNVPDLRLLGGARDVRGSHQHPRREERLDEAHTTGRGEVAGDPLPVCGAVFARKPLVTIRFPNPRCPEEEEEERCVETEEARRAAEVRVQKITKFQGKNFLFVRRHTSSGNRRN